MTPTTSSSASSPNGETDMNDIVKDLRQYSIAGSYVAAMGLSPIMREAADEIERLRNNAAAMFDAIETGRQWETIARRYGQHDDDCIIVGSQLGSMKCRCGYESAFRDLADRTPTDGA